MDISEESQFSVKTVHIVCVNQSGKTNAKCLERLAIQQYLDASLRLVRPSATPRLSPKRIHIAAKDFTRRHAAESNGDDNGCVEPWVKHTYTVVTHDNARAIYTG